MLELQIINMINGFDSLKKNLNFSKFKFCHFNGIVEHTSTLSYFKRFG